jgi:hypothetical protein
MLRTLGILALLLHSLCLSGQLMDDELLVPDSLIEKHHIKKVVENGYGNIVNPIPYWITKETYDTNGRIALRESINSSYWRYVYIFSFNDEKKTVKVQKTWYDFHNYEINRKGDTIPKRSKEVYSLDTSKINKKKYAIPLVYINYDSTGRIAERYETVKCVERKTYYAYGQKGKLIARQHISTYHADWSRLEAIDSLEYYADGNLAKETTYHFPTNGDANYDKKIETIYSYNALGLLSEKLIKDYYLSLGKKEPNVTLYKYEYAYY